VARKGTATVRTETNLSHPKSQRSPRGPVARDRYGRPRTSNKRQGRELLASFRGLVPPSARLIVDALWKLSRGTLLAGQEIEASHEQLLAIAGCSERTLQRSVARLEATGRIRRTFVPGPDEMPSRRRGRPARATRYQFVTPTPPHPETPTVPAPNEGGTALLSSSHFGPHCSESGPLSGGLGLGGNAEPAVSASPVPAAPEKLDRNPPRGSDGQSRGVVPGVGATGRGARPPEPLGRNSTPGDSSRGLPRVEPAPLESMRAWIAEARRLAAYERIRPERFAAETERENRVREARDRAQAWARGQS
jgi:hypothetical protein